MEQDGGATGNTTAGSPRDFITLAQPRRGDSRHQNEYIETPLRPQLPANKAHSKDDADVCDRPVTAQPKAVLDRSVQVSDEHYDSIICRQCGRCKCEACQGPRQLPSKWICNNKCLCSGPAIVDYCSCMCCVKGLFYHWTKDYEIDKDVSCADQPCSCSSHKCFSRWCCLGLLALPLPCLCFYWPLRGVLSICQSCYSKCTGHGCRCTSVRTSEKQLLDSNSDC